MKSLQNVSEALREVRAFQPKVTLTEAQKQAKRVKAAADKAGAKSGPPVIVTQERWEDVLKACVNAEAEVEHLQEMVETAELKMKDCLENYWEQVDQNHHISAELQSIKSCNTGVLAERETRIANLLAELKQTEGNRKYACDHIMKQNELIRDAKAAMESLRLQNEQLTAQQVNAEHLAKKVIQLQEELVRSDSYKCPHQKTPNNTIHLPCGKCIGCKLEAAYGIIERTAANVKHLEGKLRKVDEELIFKNAVLEQTAKNLAKANDDKASVEKIYSKSLNESNDLASALQREKTHLNEVIRLQRAVLEEISGFWFYQITGVSKVVNEALANVEKYKEKNNML